MPEIRCGLSHVLEIPAQVPEVGSYLPVFLVSLRILGEILPQISDACPQLSSIPVHILQLAHQGLQIRANLLRTRIRAEIMPEIRCGLSHVLEIAAKVPEVRPYLAEALRTLMLGRNVTPLLAVVSRNLVGPVQPAQLTASVAAVGVRVRREGQRALVAPNSVIPGFLRGNGRDGC